jgi:hypothetical protein
MPLTQLETKLRRVARDRIAKGQLPRVVPLQMWGGKGTGRLCALCDKAIEPNEMELEVEQRIDGGLPPLRFHVVCHSLWRLECGRAALKISQARVDIDDERFRQLARTR